MESILIVAILLLKQYGYLKLSWIVTRCIMVLLLAISVIKLFFAKRDK